MILFFDTETTGKANFNLRPGHPSQPHIVQLAAILCEPDGTERGLLNVLIKPLGWIIPAEAAAIHGITTETAARCGVPIGFALGLLSAMLQAGSMAVAHNIDFDALVVASACERYFFRDFLADIPHFCTMKNTTQICMLPGLYQEFKWPKLSEAYKHLFGEEMKGAHDAMVDVRACARIYFEITK